MNLLTKFAVLGLLLSTAVVMPIAQADTVRYNEIPTYKETDWSKWLNKNPWAAANRWDTMDKETTSLSARENYNPFTQNMIYRHPQTGHKICLDKAQAKQWGLSTYDAVRPCDQ